MLSLHPLPLSLQAVQGHLRGRDVPGAGPHRSVPLPGVSGPVPGDKHSLPRQLPRYVRRSPCRTASPSCIVSPITHVDVSRNDAPVPRQLSVLRCCDDDVLHCGPCVRARVTSGQFAGGDCMDSSSSPALPSEVFSSDSQCFISSLQIGAATAPACYRVSCDEPRGSAYTLHTAVGDARCAVGGVSSRATPRASS